MSLCDEKGVKLGKLCISNDDYLIICMNVLVFSIIFGIIYIKKLANESKNLSTVVKNNFTLLGEGALNNFYSPLAQQQKSSNTKKKVNSKSGHHIPASMEKALNNNQLKCNNCGRSIEVSYQYTMHKLNSITN